MIACNCATCTCYRALAYDTINMGDDMSTAAKRRANAKWDAKQDKFLLRLPPGDKARVKGFADQRGKSLNDFIVTAIDEHIKRIKDMQKDRP